MDEVTDEQKNTMWDEISQYIGSIELRKPGDIDKYQFRQMWKENTGREITDQYAREKMREIAGKSNGRYVYTNVFDEEKGANIAVIRVANSPNS